MESSDSNRKPANVNIDINGGTEDSGVKSMDLDAQNDCRVGLNKEELMKYANQPFWVRLRNILFASFWIIWLSILIVAIGIVVTSDRCGPKLVSAVPAASTTPSSTS